MSIDVNKGLYRGVLAAANTANRTYTFPDASGVVSLGGGVGYGDFNVKDYGATGDGVTDDATNVQAALTAGSGGAVYFPQGVYIIGTRLNVPANTTVRGAGMGASFLKHKAGYAFQVMQANGDNVLVTDIAFDGNQPNNVGYSGSEVASNGFEEVTFDRVRIINCEAYGLDATGIRTRVINCQFEGVGLATLNETAYAIYAAGASARDVLVANCTMTGWRCSAFYGGGQGFVFANNLCIDNHLQTSPTGGGQVGMTANTKDALIIGNRIYGGAAVTSGIEVGGVPTDVNSVTITGNIITDIGLYGIILQGSGDVLITGNVIRNAGAEGIYTNPNVSGFVITGNRVYDDQGVKTCPWGIYLAAGTGDNYIVAGNDLRGNINADGLNDLALGASRQVYGNLPAGGGESIDFPAGNGTLGLASALTAHEADASTHGVGVVVGTTETQTLTGKSIVYTQITGIPAVRVRHSANQSLADNTPTALTFDTEDYDTAALHDAGSNTRLTAPVTGKYSITGIVAFAANATGYRQIVIRKGGATNLASSTIPVNSAAAGTRLAVATDVALAATEYVELVATQNSTGALNSVFVAETAPVFTMHWIGP